ncbi:glycosyltransferase [candidate division KSB1 bacterium]|nr:glycosyltransferase [candidate division KSB1 bacterium]
MWYWMTWIVSSGYALLSIFLAFYLRKRHLFEHDFPSVSVIVAARNEEKHLTACLSSLSKLDYPKEKLQVTIVDDASSDKTNEIAGSFCRRFEHFNLIRVEAGQKQRPGKAGALIEGINKTDGELIFITDADCRVPRTWIKRLVSCMDESIGVTGGITLLHKKDQSLPLMVKIQSCDWLYLLAVVAASAEMNLPLSWFGNNLVVRRKAYQQTGGLEVMKHSLIEDFALIQGVAQKTSFDIKIDLHPDSVVKSFPPDRLRTFYEQRKRWSSEVSDIPLYGKIMMGVTLLGHVTLMVLLLAGQWMLSLGLFAVISLSDLLILVKSAHMINRLDLIKLFPGYKLLSIGYILGSPFILAFDRKVTWKDETFKSGSPQIKSRD